MLKKIAEILLLITLIFNLEIFSFDRKCIEDLDMNTIYMAENVERMGDPDRFRLDNINTSFVRAYSIRVAGAILVDA